jgi:hypothetical protein
MMKYLVLATFALTSLSGSASAQFDTLYGARGFLGGVRPDAAQIIQRCRGQRECIRATAKRTSVPETPQGSGGYFIYRNPCSWSATKSGSCK